MDYENIISRFNVKHSKGDSCMALCPCHDDRKASLSISYDSRDSKTLIHCHAGCSARDILDRVGLKLSDLYNGQKVFQKNRENIESVYKYTDSEGTLIFEKVRFIPKSFANRRYVDGLTVWGLDEGRYFEVYPGSGEYSKKERKDAAFRDFCGVKPVLYNLPGILEAVKCKLPVYIAEGEKDADNLIKLGLAATTNFDGASKSPDHPKWRKEYNEYLKGADVVLIPDNDIPGKNHMAQTAKILEGTAASIKIVELPVPAKEDVSYWLGQGHTKDEFLNLVENTMGCT
jgi:putative DNA primase/helicase